MGVDVAVELGDGGGGDGDGDGLPEAPWPGVDPEALAHDAERLLEALGLAASELSVVLCDDAFIRPLNHEWRDKDSATDVLSFPQEVPERPGRFDTPPDLLGDVILSAETAARQAAELGHPLGTELRVLLVHGVLHLLGYDHLTDAEAAQMRDEEARLLAVLAVPGDAGLVHRARPPASS